ncbi:MAG: LLM class flavin-dependent oxidoreductase [Chloroflexota bacterium]
MSGPIGLALGGGSGLPPRRLTLLATIAEQRGFDLLALNEGHADVFALASAIAASTREIGIQTAIANIGWRHPAMMALSAAAVDELSDGRFALGIGVGTQWFDTADGYGGALSRVREYVDAMRALWAAGQSPVSHAGAHYRVERFRMDFPPLRADVPVYLAALNPGMLRLAGAIADGVVLNLVPLDAVAECVSLVREGAASAGRRPGGVKISLLIRAGLEDDASRGREIIRSSLPRYFRFAGYAKRFTTLGYGAVVQAVQAALDNDDARGAARAIPDELVDRLAVFGPGDRCRAGVEAFRAVGVDVPIVSPRTASDDWEATIGRAIDTFGPSLSHTSGW